MHCARVLTAPCDSLREQSQGHLISCFPRHPPIPILTPQVLGLAEGYHGDTLGAMDAVAPSPFNGRLQTPWYTGRGLFLEPPTVALQQGTWRVSLPPDMVAATDEAAALAAAVMPGAQQKPFATEFGSREAVFALEQRMASSTSSGGAGEAGEAAATASLHPFYLRYIQQQLDDYAAAQQQQQLQTSSSGSVGATAGQGQQQQQARQRALGACIVEPVLQGAGGMRLIDPLYQRALVEVCRRVAGPMLRAGAAFGGRYRPGLYKPNRQADWLVVRCPAPQLLPERALLTCSLRLHRLLTNAVATHLLCPPAPPVHTGRERSIPVIFDEVFTGLWRLGAPSGAALLGISPDIACYAKLLTGGTVPLSATLASDSVFRAFEGERSAGGMAGHKVCSAGRQACFWSTSEAALVALLSISRMCRRPGGPHDGGSAGMTNLLHPTPSPQVTPRRRRCCTATRTLRTPSAARREWHPCSCIATQQSTPTGAPRRQQTAAGGSSSRPAAAWVAREPPQPAAAATGLAAACCRCGMRTLWPC